MPAERKRATAVPIAPPERVRYAIYTRKSTEEGLEQDFNSLDAQREAGESFIKSQRHEGWSTVARRYDDGGYSGANMNRPALKQLLTDVESGIIDCIVVYKVDRLTRSIHDFFKVLEILDKHSVTFVSVTQQFNTTTSMGRMTLNMLLTFAQLNARRSASVPATRCARHDARGNGPAAMWCWVTTWRPKAARLWSTRKRPPAYVKSFDFIWNTAVYCRLSRSWTDVAGE